MTQLISHEICICTRGRSRSLLVLLESLAACNNIQENLIRIVINGENPTPELLQSIEEIRVSYELNLVINYSEAGLTKARNLALDESTSELISFIDDDITVEKNCFSKIEQFFELNERIVGSAPIISGMYSELNSSFIGRVKHEWIRRNYQGKITKSGKNYWFTDNGTKPKQTSVMWLPGCCMTYRRAIINEIRFSEELQNGPTGGYSLGEDVIFSIRASKFGELHLNRETKIIHKKADGIRDNRQIMAISLGRFLAYETREESRLVSVNVVTLRLLFEISIFFAKSMLRPKFFIELKYKVMEFHGFLSELKSPILVSKGLKRER